MCGLFGLVGKAWNNTEKKVLTNLLVVSGLRGLSSTGISFYAPVKDSNQSPYSVLRMPESQGEYIMKSNYHEMCSTKGLVAAMGHTRSGNHFTRSAEHTHPFEYRGKTAHIIGAHNGGAPGFAEHSEIDSQGIFREISEKGLHSAVQRFEDTDTVALSWMNVKTHTLNFYRNANKPIYFTTFYNGSSLAWASEPEMLEFAIRREKLIPNDIYKMSAGDWLQFRLGSNLGPISKTYTIRDTQGNIKESIQTVGEEKEEEEKDKAVDYRKFRLNSELKDECCYFCRTPFQIQEDIAVVCRDEAYCNVCQYKPEIADYLTKLDEGAV